MQTIADDNGNKMSVQEYLYGEDIEIPAIPQEIIMRRIEILKDHLTEQLEHSYYTRDNSRVSAILKAISFWENINNGIN